nr:GNAT family N-acetyltransferase [Novosphingobium sp. B 225]
MAEQQVTVTPVTSKADFNAFIDLAYRLNASDPNWVAQLRSEEVEKFSPGGNPFFEHARHQYFLARRDDRVVGRISAHIDEQAQIQPVEQGMGPGTGNWGAIEAEDEESAKALIAAAEDWLRGQGMTRVLAPMNLSVWEEPGLLIKGADHPPMVMMGHQNPAYQAWIEGAGYDGVKTLYTYDLDITQEFPPLIKKIVDMGKRNARIHVRGVDKGNFDAEARTILDILNDAWSDNWGFVPITDAEVAYTGKKLKPLVREDLIMIAELDGEPVAFMMTLPDLNQIQMKTNGRGGKPSLLGWIKLGLWTLKPRNTDMRVPLMGVRKTLQGSRMASQLAFMMIEAIRSNSVKNYNGQRGEIGWVLDDNQGMNAIAAAIDSKINKEYRVYAKGL